MEDLSHTVVAFRGEDVAVARCDHVTVPRGLDVSVTRGHSVTRPRRDHVNSLPYVTGPPRVTNT